MKMTRLISASALLVMLCSFTLAAHAVTGAIKVTSIAEVDSEVTRNGKKEIKRVPANKAVPGTEVIFTTRFENVIGKTVSNVVIDNPIPNDTEYKAGSAFGQDCEILFSVDQGKTFAAPESLKLKAADGATHNALPKEYTHVRWVYKGQLAAGRTGEVGFRAVIK